MESGAQTLYLIYLSHLKFANIIVLFSSQWQLPSNFHKYFDCVFVTLHPHTFTNKIQQQIKKH